MDDARLKNIVFEFGELGSNAEIRAVIEGFTNALEALNCEVEHGNVPKSPQEILAMNQWHELQRYARAALELPLFQLYRDGRVDHQVMERLKAKGYVGAKK